MIIFIIAEEATKLRLKEKEFGECLGEKIGADVWGWPDRKPQDILRCVVNENNPRRRRYVTTAIEQIELADRIVDIRNQHLDPWDRKQAGFEANIELNYALLIGKPVEKIDIYSEQEETP